MERNFRKSWDLLGIVLFFLIFISLAAPSNEILDRCDGHNHANMKLETEDKQNESSHSENTYNSTNDPYYNSTFAGAKIIELRNKRPVRLLPHHLLYGQMKNDTEEMLIVKEFNGPPTSCDDLAILGYTLNGNYLVNGKNVPENLHKVEEIACLFKTPPGREGEGLKKEERFGLVSMLDGTNKIDAASTSNRINGAKGVGRIKRPARLIPLKLLFDGADKNVTDNRFYGPATDCSDLQKLGYTLNGYYLVKGKEPKFIDNEVEVVYCQFKFLNRIWSKKVLKIGEVRIGSVNLSPSELNTVATGISTKGRKTRNTNTFHDQLLKRPARLLPLKYILGDEKNITETHQTTRFYGLAYNCDDLRNLGYTLNGYYIVNSHEKSRNERREVVICRFKQSLSSEQAKIEQRLGFLATKGDVDFVFGENSFCPFISSPSSAVDPAPSLGVIHNIAGSPSSSSRNSGLASTDGRDVVKNGICYQLMEFQPSNENSFLSIKGYTEGKPIRSGAMLITRKVLKGVGIQGDSIWVQRDRHFCSFVGAQCLTLSYRKTSRENAVTVNLTPYNETDSSQKWEMRKAKPSSTEKELFVHVETSLCFTNEFSTAKELRAKLCEEENWDQKWWITSINDTPEERQRFLAIKNSSIKKIKKY